jgi:hypothetical protein
VRQVVDCSGISSVSGQIQACLTGYNFFGKPVKDIVMPAVVTVEKKELLKSPAALPEIRGFCHSIRENEQCVVLEPKIGYLTPLTLAVSKFKLSYEVTFQDTPFTKDNIEKVLAEHS